MKESAPFTLKATNSTFLQRQKNIFSQLNEVKTNLQNPSDEVMEVDEETAPEQKFRRLVTKQFRCKESIFKRPQEQPITKSFMRKMPDFKKNPHKWTKYSLEDVREDHMSEQSNTKAALSFLNELKNRNSARNTDEDDEPKKIVFKRALKITKDTEDEAKTTFRSSKVIMPEYVVGQKVEKDKKKKVERDSKGMSNKELKLDHLYEDE